MAVQPVNSVNTSNKIRNYYNLSKVTGYGAFGTGGLCLLQGMRHKKSHKIFGLVSLLLASAHVGLIEWMHRNPLK